MYPLNVTLPAPAIGFAVANNETEHAALAAVGYVPALVLAPAEQESDEAADELMSVKAKLDELGVSYDKRLGLAKLKALLPAE